jgi:hypothetical protein
MNLMIDGSAVRCERQGSDGKARTIASFDCHLEGIAPHVAAALSVAEREELTVWLAENQWRREGA